MGKGRRRRSPKRRRGPLLKWMVAIAIVFAILIGISWMASRPTPPPKPVQLSEPEPPSTPSTPSKPAAVVGIVDQFYTQSPDFTDRAVKFLESHGISVKVHRDKEVTVELYRKLPTYGYRLIILRVHAGVEGGAGPTYLFTSENYTSAKYTVEQLTGQIKSGVTNPNASETPVFTISPLFITMSMEGNFNGAVTIVSSCLGLYTTELADAIISKGARVFVSWDEKVSLEHTDKATLLLLKALLEEKATIKQAVERVMDEVGADPTYGAVFKYYPPQNGGLHPLSVSSGNPARMTVVMGITSRLFRVNLRPSLKVLV